MNLIDKEKVVAEIKRKIEAHKETLENCDSSISEMVLKGSMSAYQNLLFFLDTLEVKEVDLEKETKKWWKERLHLNPENQLWMDAHQSLVFAKHFFELGINARKEDE